MIEKFRYNPDTGRIEKHSFLRETKAYLFLDDATKVSKTASYDHDFYDTYESCRKATLAILEIHVKAAKDILADKRTTLAAFKENNPR